MNDHARFNLEAAIASWRRFVLAKRTISADDAEELEIHLRDEIGEFVEEGMDLESAFHAAAERMGDRATLESAYDSVYLKKLHADRGLFSEMQWWSAVLKNYLNVAVRNLRRHLGFTFINVAGLAIGLACCLLILHFVRHEQRYDRHHEHADRVYRVTTHYASDGRHWAATSPPVGPALAEALPEVEEVARFVPITSSVVLHHEDRPFEHTGGMFADPAAFDVLSLPLMQGDPESALAAPNSIVLSERLAQRIFGEADPIGQTLSATLWEDLTVTGVMEDLPPTTHLPFEFMVSMATFYEREPEWAGARNWERFYTYVLLRTPTARAAVEQKLPRFAASFFVGDAGVTAASAPRLHLQPLTDIHLHSQLEREYQANRDVRYVYLFSAIALFVLLIACVNFVNLSTARATQRRREVGVRKVLGADRRSLVGQFLGEAVLLALLAVLLAGLLAAAGLPLFNRLAGTSFTLAALLTPVRVASFVGIGLAAGIVSGLYPAMVLSGFRPTQALRGSGSTAGWSTTLRKGLVTFQFAVSIFLLISTAVIYRQFQYIQEKPLGFDRDQIVTVWLNRGEIREAVTSNPETIKQELKRHPAIEQVSLASSYPGDCCNVEPVRLHGSADPDPVNVRIGWGVDHDYLATLGVSLAEGRDFSKHAPADTAGWLINRAAARRLGADDPLGQTLHWRGHAAPIVGIMEDYHFTSLHSAIEPLVLPLRPTAGHMLLVRVQAGQAAAALRHVEEQFGRIVPGQIFRYAFLENEFRQQYAAEDQLRGVVTVFSLLAIVVACLGLFGLAAFTAQQRTKEIGIRKVLGARASSIVVLLARDFVKLVVLAFAVAAPLGYVVMSRWLEIFAYYADISVVVFLAAGGVALLVALLTVSYQAVRAALADPVSSLKYE